MNAQTQTPQNSGFFATLKTFVTDSMRHLFLQGAQVPIAGVTGNRVKQSHREQVTASKSQRMMRKERGRQPQHVGQRRIDRTGERLLKKRNSYCNNVYIHRINEKKTELRVVGRTY